MTRSVKKGPFVDVKLMEKVRKAKLGDTIKTWARRSQIAPEFVGFIFQVHNGKSHVDVLVTEEMVGYRLGEFAPSKTFRRHGGKMQKEAEAAKKAAEISAAKAAKPAATPGKK